MFYKHNIFISFNNKLIKVVKTKLIKKKSKMLVVVW